VKSALLISVAGIVLMGGCGQYRFNKPAYYAVPEQEMLQSARLSKVVILDSLDVELLEWAVFHETNIQRQRLGLSSINFDSRLQDAARQHSSEMVRLQYFDHDSPVDGFETVAKRLTRHGISSGFGGENIAIHPAVKKDGFVFRISGAPEETRSCWRNSGKHYTYMEFAKDLVRRWLNSAPHRRNILNRGYKFVGIGAVPSRYQDSSVFYVTQNFSSTNF